MKGKREGEGGRKGGMKKVTKGERDVLLVYGVSLILLIHESRVQVDS